MASPPTATRTKGRAALLLALLASEIASLHVPYYGDLTGTRAALASVIADVMTVIGYMACAGAAFFVICWPKRRSLSLDWRNAARDHRWKPWALTSAACASLLFLGTLTSRHLITAPPVLIASVWGIGVAATLSSFVLAVAPGSFWHAILQQRRREALMSLVAALSLFAFSQLAQSGWSQLSGATLRLSAWVLGAVETDLHIDIANRLLGVGDFTVRISSECSGYEGIALVLGFLLLYMLLFRRQLKFPNAVLLFPIAGIGIWILNAVRIAALVIIGAEISPGMAMHGFHSQAGSLAFLAIALGLMAGASHVDYFRAQPAPARRRREDRGTRMAKAYLLPFAILMLGNIVTSMFLGYGQWLYTLDVVGVGVLLWIYRDIYGALLKPIAPSTIVIGFLIGAVWAWSEPSSASANALDQWIASLGAAPAAAWIVLRVLVLVVLVPFGEELAFRGYLHRALIGRRFETIEPGRFSWLAFVITTIVFAALHTRWLAALLAGAGYAFVMYRSNRLSDPIAAHAMSNAILAAIAIATRHWDLL